MNGNITWAPGWQVYKANFNNDGRDDLFLYNSFSGWAGLWFKVTTLANGSFGYIAGDTTWDANWQIYPGDFDGDGLTDLFIYRTTDGQAFRVTFTATSASYVGQVWGRNWVIKTGDFNGDGRTDLFLFDPTVGGRWAVPVANASWFTIYYGDANAGADWEPHPTLLDGDNMSDVLWYRPSTGDTTVWIAGTVPTFTVAVGPTIGANLTLILDPP